MNAPAERAQEHLHRAWRAVGVVLVPYVVARLVVLSALAFAHLVVSRAHPSAATAARVHQGLLGWDAGWYEAIAKQGYEALGHDALRFFPLLPLGARLLGAIPGVGAGPALIVIANVCSLVATACLYQLVRRETANHALSEHAVWLVSLAPPAFTFVMGYAESTLLMFCAACFLCLRPTTGRSPRWLGAGVAAALGALTRPLGVLLVLAIAVEAGRWWGRSARGTRIASLVAVIGPLAGMGGFLCWSWAVFGDGLLPLRVQVQAGHHGALSDPFSTLAHDASGVLHHHFGTALHVPWVVLVLVLLVVTWQRWPASYGAFATGVVLVAVTGTNLDSFERYALSAFPLVFSAASLTISPRWKVPVIALAGAGLAGYALLGFLNLNVP